MCGILAAAGHSVPRDRFDAALDLLRRRGPDDRDVADLGRALLGHRRLSILDLSADGRQPMSSTDGRFSMVLNGEIYNYLELREELSGHLYRTRTDTEVVLAAYETWGEKALDRFVGMFALAIWDAQEETLFLARDRFGVKPLYYHMSGDTLLAASEIKALLALGVPATPDLHAWRQYLAYGLYEHSDRTFFEHVRALPAGCFAKWNGEWTIRRWYDLPAIIMHAGQDLRSVDEVTDEYLSTLEECVRLRFRSDVPVGVNLSSGLDSSILLALIRRIGRGEGATTAFTYSFGEAPYDETPGVRALLEPGEPWEICMLGQGTVMERAAAVAAAEDEPFGGLPTIAISALCERAKAVGVTVLLDGQGMDEQWGGYDYYWRDQPNIGGAPVPAVQGSRSSPTDPSQLAPDFFHAGADGPDTFPAWTGDDVVDLRLRDILHTKIPRALRFNDRASMMQSCELREPFLDHRLVEIALRQPADRLKKNGERKYLLRQMARHLLPDSVRLAPKQAVQSPQREWLSGPLAPWVLEQCASSHHVRDWFRPGAAEAALQKLAAREVDNSFFVWQMLSVALWEQACRSEVFAS